MAYFLTQVFFLNLFLEQVNAIFLKKSKLHNYTNQFYYRPFYDMLQRIDEFFTWAWAHDVQQTVFVPSAKFLSGLSGHHKTALASEPGLIRKVNVDFFFFFFFVLKFSQA